MLLLAALENCQAPAASPEERIPETSDGSRTPCRATEYPILFESARGSDGLDAHVFSMKADGSGITQIAAQGDFYGAVWSPEGRRIAFRRSVWLDSVSPPASEIGLMTADGAELVSLIVDEPMADTTTAHDRQDGPTWSPDGRSIAFASRDAPAAPWAVWAIPASGGAARRLMPELDVSHFDVSFSPRTSNDVVYVAESDGVGDIWRVDLSRSEHENLTLGSVLSPQSPRFSPDGGRLVFSGARRSPSALVERDRDLYMLDLVTRELTTLTPGDSNDFGAVWSPDGRSILFARTPPPVAGREVAMLDLMRISIDSPDQPIPITQDHTANFAPDWYSHASCDARSNDENSASP